jgi:hypothetical protein
VEDGCLEYCIGHGVVTNAGIEAAPDAGVITNGSIVMGKLCGIIELLQGVLWSVGNSGCIRSVELGIIALCEKQRLHRESWIICGEDRYSVEKGIECWMRDV